MRCRCAVFSFAWTVVVAAGVAAQGLPTGALRGQVVDPAGLPLPGVLVTAASPVLQGKRTTVTSPNGDFIVPFLPPGEYSVTFELQGFRPHTQVVGVGIGDVPPLAVTLALADVVERVNVQANASTEIGKAATLARTYTAPVLEHLPVGRTLNDVVLLAPGTTVNGLPNNNIVISGALSYDNLYLANGVILNGAIIGAPLPLYIEDAIQETHIATGNISAEYGRFQGGVVNMITRSGGNAFSGSLRTSLTNDAWRARTPYPADRTVDSLTPTLELTAGGPVRRDRIWFFGAARFTNPKRNVTLPFTSVNYSLETLDERGEGKLTYALNPGHRLKGSYAGRGLRTKNNTFGRVMDLASLYDNGTDYGLWAVNYTGVLTSRVFVEGQYSKKVELTTGTGSRFDDLVRGTPILDGTRGQARFNSPAFCNVCSGGWLEYHDNWDWFAKVGYFLSTRKLGSHHIVAGVDTYEETRQNNNWQSGSGFTIEAGDGAIIEGATIYPVFASDRTYIMYQPLVADSVGNDIRTYSAFVNDAWRYGARLSLNLGLRYDRNRSRDQTGLLVVSDGALSPRLGLSWDPRGNGTWNVNAGFARYVTAVNTLLVDVASPGGRTANYSYVYQGPPINTAGSLPYLTAHEALPRLFDWFFANGGLSRPLRDRPAIPGLTRRIAPGTRAPSSHEYSIGLTRDIGRQGAWRVDYLFRNYRDMYGDFVDMTTGRVTDPAGREHDFAIVGNSPDAKRTYRGLTASLTYRTSSAQLGANYTLSWSRGNVDGEGPTTAFFRTMIGTYPEYREARWNSPMGYNANDQRHKLRAWVAQTIPFAARFGTLTVGLLQRLDSALPYDAAGPVGSSLWVINPGYQTPPTTVAYYFSPRYGLRWESAWSTDVSLNWSKTMAPTRASVFFRGVVTNIFNHSAVISGNSTVLTAWRAGGTNLRPFNPFVERPVPGVHWAYGRSFGKPTEPASHQPPRTFSCSAGIRF